MLNNITLGQYYPVDSPIHRLDPRIKLILDLTCLTLSFVLALTLTGKLTGIGVGTVVIAVANAPLIRLWSKPVDKYFRFDPLFPRLEQLLK